MTRKRWGYSGFTMKHCPRWADSREERTSEKILLQGDARGHNYEMCVKVLEGNAPKVVKVTSLRDQAK